MSDWTQEEREEILGLLNDGESRLKRIKGDLKSLVQRSEDLNDPAARMIKDALREIDVDSQFRTIADSQRKIRFVRATFDIDDLKPNREREKEMLAELDVIKKLAVKIRAAAELYARFVDRHISSN